MSKSDATGELSIGGVARATGLSESAIRAWERRYGFPRPARATGGHRRYAADDVEVLRRAVEERAAGAAVPDAIAIARRSEPVQPGALFAAVRERFPELGRQPMQKRALTALSHAIEDEIASRAAGGVLAGSFQRPRFFRASQGRWADMAAGTEVCFVLAGFRSCARRGPIDEVALPAGSPLSREWALAWRSDGIGAFLVANERPGQRGRRDGGRLFDVAWGVDPEATRYATGALVAAASGTASAVARRAERTLERLDPPAARDQLRLGAAITSRALATLPL